MGTSMVQTSVNDATEFRKDKAIDQPAVFCPSSAAHLGLCEQSNSTRVRTITTDLRPC